METRTRIRSDSLINRRPNHINQQREVNVQLMVACFFFCFALLLLQHRTLGDPTTEEEVTKNAAVVDSDGKPVPISVDASDGGGSQNLVSDTKGGGGLAGDSSSNKPKTISAIVARPDGLLKNIKEEVEVSREETKERTVHEERKHFGDFTDDVSTMNTNWPYCSYV